MSSRGRAGLVSLAALDLRHRPEHRAELGSQLLMGEPVRVIGVRRDGWLRLASLADGYRGWARAWGIASGSMSVVRARVRRQNGRVVSPFARVVRAPGSDAALTPLCLGSRVEVVRATRGWARVQLPDDRLGWVRSRDLSIGRRARPHLRARIESLMGAPYLWGGRTPLGFDCSGFTQIVLAEQGVALPRDARDQFACSRELRRSERAAPGDLAFFARPRESVSHVGIVLDRGTYVHCRGTVRIASIDPLSPLCDKALLAQFRGIRRPSRVLAKALFRRLMGGESA